MGGGSGEEGGSGAGWPRRPCPRTHPSRFTPSPLPPWMTSCTPSLKSALLAWRGATCSWWVLLAPCPLPPAPPGSPHPRLPSLPTASLCLCDDAAVGLCSVPGCSGPRWCAAGGPGSGLGPGALCPVGHRLQRCHYPGRPGLQADLGLTAWAAQILQLPAPCPSRCCLSWHWASAWTTYSCWHTPSQRLHLAPLSR